MDTLDIDDPHFDRKILDLQRRYDEQYGRIEEIESQINDVKGQILNIQQEKISAAVPSRESIIIGPPMERKSIKS